MSLMAFEGGAGSGKTHSVMEELAGELSREPLKVHQRVLALTFMHGARHRLDEKLEGIGSLRGRYDAMTIDSFAWTICRRWQSRLRAYGQELPDLEQDGAFDTVCGLAARLLEDADVRKWVTASYPYILIDEAQDLFGPRLAMVDQLRLDACVLLAFDDFQCLNSRNRPVAVVGWIAERCHPKVLQGCRRTNVTELLQAATEIRDGKAIAASGSSFQVKLAPGGKTGPALPATLAAYAMMKTGTFALLSPSRPASSAYVRDIVEMVRTQSLGKAKNVGPFDIRWEGAEEEPIKALRMQLRTAVRHGFRELVRMLSDAGFAAAAQTAQQLRRLRAGRGQEEFATSEVEALLDRQIAVASQFTRRPVGRRRAMTIHQAKNREFDHVVVLWPFQIPPDDDDRRRLLYNAVTRARQSCLVLVQAPPLLEKPPFV
ncbi:MAG TPA: ATP-dependent helicase [Caulobacteraceae bacterium]|jgi:hypothetical protein|nr:ATP-dependent helicase [Caulobacteraceae bacterium]